jgi:hypothetical protein
METLQSEHGMNTKNLFCPARHFFLVMGILIVAGCQFDSHYSSYTRTKPNIADLTGTYVLTNQTLNEQPITNLHTDKGVTASTPTLVLRSDGTFVATNIPQWSDGGATTYWTIKDFKSGSGKWVLEGDSEGGWGLAFESANMNLPNINEQGTFLIGDRVPYPILFNLARDADFDDAMTFEKKTQ